MSGWADEMMESQQTVATWIEIKVETLVRGSDDRPVSVVDMGSDGEDYLLLEDGTRVTADNVADYSCPDESEYQMKADFHRAMEKED